MLQWVFDSMRYIDDRQMRITLPYFVGGNIMMHMRKVKIIRQVSRLIKKRAH